MSKKVVVIGGGVGQSTLLRGLKQIDLLELTAIVTVADDGGSTGRLRQQFDIPAMGDIRNVMIALAESESMLAAMMAYRFKEDPSSELAGHNLGNLILTAMMEKTGNFMEAILALSSVLKVKGAIVPSTLEIVTLYAQMIDGTIVKGEANIPKKRNRISRVYYQNKVKASKEALEAIKQADVILYGIGSLYTSICSNLIIEDIQQALKESKAKKIYVCNAMSQAGETDGYFLEDHVEAIVNHSHIPVDMVIKANDLIPYELIKKYQAMESHPVLMQEAYHDYALVEGNLLRFQEGLIRHDPEKIAVFFKQLLKDL